MDIVKLCYRYKLCLVPANTPTAPSPTSQTYRNDILRPMEDARSLLAITAGILALGSFIPYFTTTLAGKTKPNRVTWWIWTLQGWILTSTYYLAGGEHNIWLPLADTVLITIIAILSLRYGTSGHSILDTISLVGALGCIAVWLAFGSPLTTLYFGIFVSIIGAVPTIIKTYREPDTESRLAWGTFSVAATLNIFALPTLFSPETVYPFYLLAINGLIFLLTFVGKKTLS